MTARRDRPEMVRYVARDQMAERAKNTPPRADVTVSGDASTAVLRLYDVIDSWGGFWGISANEVAAALDELPSTVRTCEVHLNSPGGEAREGVAIANLLRQCPQRVVAIVDGLAASAASIIAMGADELLMAPSSELMIHEAHGGAYGDADFLAQQSRVLDHLSDSYAAAYAAKAGGDPSAWRVIMRAETWYSPEEAVAAGLVDGLAAVDPERDEQAAAARLDRRVFAFASRAEAPAPPNLPPASAAGSAAPRGTTREESAVSDTLLTGLRERLGTAEDADEATVLAALDESLAEQAEPTPGPTPTDPTPPEVPPAALAEVARLSTELAELKAQASARTKAEHFAAWQREGRTSPAERSQLEVMYDAAPEQTVALIGARAKGSAVPLAAIGHDSDPDTLPATAATVRESDVYKNWSTA